MAFRLACFVLTVLLTYSSANNTADIPECVSNDDCATDRVCAKQECMDPCAGVCGPHTVCHVTNHVAMCSCSPGHSGNPIIGCSASSDTSRHWGCTGHDQCPNSKACILGKCDDPCDDICGDNTVCTVHHHIPACACKDGHTGNPFIGCTLQVAPGTWPPIPHGNKRFYVENLKTADWHGAFMSCLMNNSRLASVESMEELEAIRHEIRKTGIRLGEFWTSGSDHGYEGHYLWTTTGTQLPSRSDLWLPGQPDNHQNNEHCVEVWEWQRFGQQGYRLNDRTCDGKIHYICEYYS